MKRYAVIGASSGTGLALVRYLASRQTAVRAIARHPPQSGPFIEPFAADVTDARSIAKALDGEFDAVFYTVDIHGLFKPRKDIRAVMFQGFVNAIHAAAQAAVPPKFVLQSVIGPERPSWVWWVLNATKPGMQRNILDREQALKDSGFSYVICRAAKLNDEVGGCVPVAATPPQHKLDMKRGIPRTDLARALILAAERAPREHHLGCLLRRCRTRAGMAAADNVTLQETASHAQSRTIRERRETRRGGADSCCRQPAGCINCSSERSCSISSNFGKQSSAFRWFELWPATVPETTRAQVRH